MQQGHSVSPSSIEIINPDYARGPFRCAVFDFDGTLSLLRGNWQGLMVPMMVETLLDTGTSESREALTTLVEEFVTRLTGQPTLRQILALADEVVKRGRQPPDVQTYLGRYLDSLVARTSERIAAVQSGRVRADEMLVPGARPLVEQLLNRDFMLAISSGTELSDVQREATVLDIDQFFAPRIFGPVNNDVRFSKERVLRQLMAEHGLKGSDIVGIGDGPAETLAIKAVEGLAVGVASNEVNQDGRINLLKREHLIRSGADLIIPDYSNSASLLAFLKPVS